MGESPEKQQLSLALDEPEELFKTGDLELELQTESPPPADNQTPARTSFWARLANIMRG